MNGERSELPPGYEGYALMYRMARMFHVKPEDVAGWTMDKALLYADLDKYAGYMEELHYKRMRARAKIMGPD